MDHEKNKMNANNEQTVAKIVEQVIDPKFEEQDRKMEQLRADMRIAIGGTDFGKIIASEKTAPS
ncbi:MAG: hypothetical protein ISN28_03635 [Ectothiorhodospiraceae bacterium AqS1]|nr:hypothetical protein [Ectothiorhodospiraceae bacterium AqS1]